MSLSLDGTSGISTTGNIIANSITANSFSGGSGNLVSGNILTSGQVSATGNVTGGNIITLGNVDGNNVNATRISVTGNITTGNLLFGSGNISGTGDIRSGTFSSHRPGGCGRSFLLIGNTISSIADSILYLIQAGTGGLGGQRGHPRQLGSQRQHHHHQQQHHQHQ
jgi:hypothetical protein